MNAHEHLLVLQNKTLERLPRELNQAHISSLLPLSLLASFFPTLPTPPLSPFERTLSITLVLSLSLSRSLGRRQIKVLCCLTTIWIF